MNLRKRTLFDISDMICGDFESDTSCFFVYRPSSRLTEFFEDCGLRYVHDGSTRRYWVSGVMEKILTGRTSLANQLPGSFLIVIRALMDRADATNEGTNRPGALAHLNACLARDGLQAYFDERGVCQIRNTATGTKSPAIQSPPRAWTKEEEEAREKLAKFLDTASEDEITEKILLPLFRGLGFLHITAAGHKDKALEYGKDIWMKFQLPTLHSLYFGVQVKKGKLDASVRTVNSNIAEVLDQIRMMLGHVVFDPEINKRVLIDHAIIVAGGDITKQARNWLGEQLDASQRSQILFMDRDHLLDLWLALSPQQHPRTGRPTTGES